jgi:hypothetical protein
VPFFCFRLNSDELEKYSAYENIRTYAVLRASLVGAGALTRQPPNSGAPHSSRLFRGVLRRELSTFQASPMFSASFLGGLGCLFGHTLQRLKAALG